LSVRQENSLNPEHPQHSKPLVTFWYSRTGLVPLGFLAIAGFFLLTGHRAHVPGALPYVLLALCPLLHLSGHGVNDAPALASADMALSSLSVIVNSALFKRQMLAVA
jgi:hypothetical protein